jgi:hypothetical protein
MGSNYEQAVAALYRAPHESFVTERRRLADELKAEGDKLGAARLSKMARPPISAWVVNQLWWHAREAFDELFETAAQLRAGKLSASPAHRSTIVRLGARAQQLLREDGHSPNEATLRRVTMTLSGLAAAGSFEPDPPGALTKDRELQETFRSRLNLPRTTRYLSRAERGLIAFLESDAPEIAKAA